MKLKVCGLNNPQNILDVLSVEPDYIGFIFYNASPRYIGNLDAAFVNGIMHVKKVGVFVNEGEVSVLEKVARYGLDLVQLHGNESPEFCARINLSVPVIKVFQVDDSFNSNDVKVFERNASYFLFDTKTDGYGGSGKLFDHSKLASVKTSTPYFISGGLSNENISSVVANQSCYAIDVNSKFELSPGIKNIEQLKALKQKMNELRSR